MDPKHSVIKGLPCILDYGNCTCLIPETKKHKAHRYIWLLMGSRMNSSNLIQLHLKKTVYVTIMIHKLIIVGKKEKCLVSGNPTDPTFWAPTPISLDI